jgi:predicted O-methyltransferase YrrM
MIFDGNYCNYDFTNRWFENDAMGVWNKMFPKISPKPSRVLEIGSYEGKATCYIMEIRANTQDIEIYAVDSWSGGTSADKDFGIDYSRMPDVEMRFLKNTSYCISKVKHEVSLTIEKGFSSDVLPRLFGKLGKEYFDFIYIDGSHQAPDVMTDAVMGFYLLRVGGIMVFDDYMWVGDDESNNLLLPKLAIDSFSNIFHNKFRLIPHIDNYQVWGEKVSS